MCSCVLLFFFFSTCDVGGSTYIRVDQQSCKYGSTLHGRHCLSWSMQCKQKQELEKFTSVKIHFCVP